MRIGFNSFTYPPQKVPTN